MKRFLLLYILFSFLALQAVHTAAGGVSGSKHDLSYRPTGTFVALQSDPALGGTTQICVFCHTPHGGNTDAPLWNRTSTQTGYTVYASDVLSALGVTAENPTSGAGVAVHVKTRICLTCHDGTVALGTLANLPSGIPSSTSRIEMRGGNYIPTSSPGYIGLDLSDDHPVAILHDNTKDPELIAPLTGAVRLYGSSGGMVRATNQNANYVECTSCHDVHNNDSTGNFLIESISGSTLCRDCHKKFGVDQGVVKGIHGTSTTNYNASGGVPNLGVTVGGVANGMQCMVCHYSHKAGITPGSSTPNAQVQAGKYLLSFKQENTCFNNNPDRWGSSPNSCHSGGGSSDIKILIGQTSAHRVGSQKPYEPKLHGATELSKGPGWFNNTSWHVECADCHNPHTAGSTGYLSNGLTGTNVIGTGSSLYGAGFVGVSTWAGSWNTLQNFVTGEPLGATNANESNYTASTHYEYEVCFKCHSGFSTNYTDSNFPQSTSLFMTMTDQSKEFNPGNASFHPVVKNTNRTQGTLVNTWRPWGVVGNNTMYCSDCHTKNGSSSVPPQGPHGSTNTSILSANYNDQAVQAGSADGNTDFCLVCHDPNVYLQAINGVSGIGKTGFTLSGGSENGYNLHTQHAYRAGVTTATPILNPYKYRCVNCHIRITHGWNAARRAMVLFDNDANASTYKPSGLAVSGLITGATSPGLPASPGGYTYPGGPPGTNLNQNCSTVAGCHHN